MGERHAPRWVRAGTMRNIYLSLPCTVLRNWLVQGMLYMFWGERLLKIVWEVIFFGILASALYPLGLPWWGMLLCVGFGGHTLNWLFNGQFFCLSHAHLNMKPIDVVTYPQGLLQRLQDKGCIQTVFVMGSFSREELSSTSDLDVRVVARPGLWAEFLAAWLVMVERCRALFAAFPLDIFVLPPERGLDRIRADEIPIIVFDHTGYCAAHYSEVIEYSDAVAEFNAATADKNDMGACDE